LFDENQNVSEKSLQSAEGILHANEADERATEQQLTLQESVARQEWGGVVASWAVEGSAELQAILDLREVFVQITIPAGATLDAPRTISLEIPGQKQSKAKLLSSFPRVDPRIQGRAYLYMAGAEPTLGPGVNLVAHLASGDPVRGVLVPTSAVVWLEGQAWTYEQTGSDRFVRRLVRTDMPVEGGFFVTERFSSGARVVTQGAQALLSSESILRGQVGGEKDKD
jgi:hypothetical protein